MFKRIARKQDKKARAEELGIDETIYDVQDSDSDDSNSENSDDESESGGEDRGGTGVSMSEGEDDNGLEIDDALVGEDGDEDDDEDSEAESDASESEPPMTIAYAVKEPVYEASLEKDERVCVVCPGKLLKNSKMVEAHIGSKVSTSRHPVAEQVTNGRFCRRINDDTQNFANLRACHRWRQRTYGILSHFFPMTVF